MTEKWAQQSHKAFPPCLAQRVHCADDRYKLVSPAMMDPPDVSDGINERVSVSGAQRNRFAGIRLLSGPKKAKWPDTRIRETFYERVEESQIQSVRPFGDIWQMP